jgi:hypothetical protein
MDMHPQTHFRELSNPPMIDVSDIKREVEQLSDRLGKTQEYL